MNTPMPAGVIVDKAQVDDFVDGVFGENRRRNRAALEKAAGVIVLAVAYTAYKNSKPKRVKY